MNKIILGGHWNTKVLEDGWKIYNKEDQDIIEKLKFEDNSIKCIFTEHVVENLHFCEAVDFFKESLRVLEEDGVFRILVPGLNKIFFQNYSDENGKKYVDTVTNMFLNDKKETLISLGFQDGIHTFPKEFMINSIFYETKHHTFIWTENLLLSILKAVGFKNVYPCNVGRGKIKDYCIERKCRHIYMGYDPEEDANMGFTYDEESIIVEAIK
jgi:hypothetical protein